MVMILFCAYRVFSNEIYIQTDYGTEKVIVPETYEDLRKAYIQVSKWYLEERHEARKLTEHYTTLKGHYDTLRSDFDLLYTLYNKNNSLNNEIKDILLEPDPVEFYTHRASVSYIGAVNFLFPYNYGVQISYMGMFIEAIGFNVGVGVFTLPTYLTFHVGLTANLN